MPCQMHTYHCSDRHAQQPCGVRAVKMHPYRLHVAPMCHPPSLD